MGRGLSQCTEGAGPHSYNKCVGVAWGGAWANGSLQGRSGVEDNERYGAWSGPIGGV